MSRKEFLAFSTFAIASVFGVVGLIRELSSRAATPTADIELEDGTVAAPAAVVTDATASGGSAVKFGTITTGDRSTLVLGTYKPSTATTGVLPGVALTTITAATTYTQSGTAASPIVIQNMKFMNKVSINGCKYMTFQNCAFYGPPAGAAYAGAINSTNFNNANLVFQDCLITQQAPTTEGAVGVQGGHNSTFLRCEFKDCGDGIALVHSQGTWANAHDGPMNLTVLGCYMHDLAYFSPEPSRSPDDNASHCDLIQIRGGSNIIIRYNTLVSHLDPNIGAANQPSVNSTDSSGNPIHVSGNKYYPDMNGTSVMMVSPYLAPFHDIYVENNWIDGGSYSFNLADVGMAGNTDSNINFRNNKWGRSMRLGEQATIIARANAQTSGVLTISGNTYEDNGAAANFRGNGGP